VYNADNIARVRRDEARAEAEEKAKEQRKREEEADGRLAILRGEQPSPPLDVKSLANDKDDDDNRLRRRKRKRRGEDDTDFEMRLARERWEDRYEDRDDDRDGDRDCGERVRLTKRTKTTSAAGFSSSAPLVDPDGYIDLFGQSRRLRDESRSERQRRADEPVHNMKFSDAAGKDDRAKAQPWYVDGAGADKFNKTNVWGTNDPGRRDRAIQQISSDDPLLVMRSGASKVRALDRARKRTEEGRAQELDDLIRDEQRAAKKKSRDLDQNRTDDGDGRRHRHRHRHRHRSRSFDRERTNKTHERSRSRSRSPRRRRD